MPVIVRLMKTITYCRFINSVENLIIQMTKIVNISHHRMVPLHSSKVSFASGGGGMERLPLHQNSLQMPFCGEVSA